jgi:hypothetical protein
MCGRIARGAVALVLVCGVIASSAVSATMARAQVPAPPGGGGGSLRDEAISIMKLTYKQFIWLKQNNPVPPFDWSSDGCSWTPNVKYFNLAKIFNPACQLHEFGYRNFGKGLNLGHNERTRAWIDGRFLTEMERICNDKWGSWWQWANKEACRGEANVMYKVVRKFSYWASPKATPKPPPARIPRPTPTPRPTPGPPPPPAPPKSSDDAYPCGARVHVRWDSALEQPCPLAGPLREPGGYWVPAYSKATAERLAAVRPIGWLHSTSGQYFRCQARFARDYVHPQMGWRNDWWAYAQTDDGHWGWVPEVYFHGGSNDQPVAGLVIC